MFLRLALRDLVRDLVRERVREVVAVRELEAVAVREDVARDLVAEMRMGVVVLEAAILILEGDTLDVETP